MGRKVSFQQSLLGREVDNIPVSNWCCADLSDKFKGKCLCCPAGLQPFGLTFSTKEGFSATKKRATSVKHRENCQDRADKRS